MPKHVVSLADKYVLDEGRVFLTGTQALVRLPMMQRKRDLAAGASTACFISGYRGSPLGGFDQQLMAAKRFLDEHHIVFQPGVNEDLAATAVWGSQQAHLNGENRYDGVFGIWYGKGPGVDRSGDALRHGNLAGSAPLGGVLVLMGDDHTCESSTTAHQSEFALVDAMIPVLSPAGVQEILDLGLHGWALSRYSGCWVGLKCMKDTIDVTASVAVDPGRVVIRTPTDFAMPEGGLNIRWPDHALQQEARLHEHKIEAARAYCRANGLDRLVVGAPGARIGIATCGKSYLDVRQALDDLGIDEAKAARLGIRLYKVGMTWPLEPEGARRFAEGLDLVIVVEEKRALVETQLKEILYGLPGAPRVVGKTDEAGAILFRSAGALDSNDIALALADRILAVTPDEGVAARRREIAGLGAGLSHQEVIARIPYFCSGCPHNSSTKVPEGSRAMAGIGCHFMAVWMDRTTAGFTQMGGEGASWIGEAPFVKSPHVFQNIGDGTYYHSGLLAIRAAIASKVNITYKILFNDAVAMTGGQHHDGPLDPAQITRQMYGEGVRRIAVVSDEPEKYPLGTEFAPGTTVHHRSELDDVQRELREIPGTTVIVYDQTCAAEKRRRRKRGLFPDPAKRAFINDLVCEGCGDCGVKSNCVSVTPLETEFGRKRAIDQSSCNKDFSCVEGFCPSFVTVHGGAPRKGKAAAPGPAQAPFPVLPDPVLPSLEEGPWSIVVTGVGGTGVVTVGAVLGMAAHIEEKGCAVLDMAGLAQKGGAVMSHIRIARRPEDIQTVRIAAGGARLILGCDMIVAGGTKTLATVSPGKTDVIVNSHETMTGDFTRNADLSFPQRRLRQAIESAAGQGHADFVEATRLATALMGDSIATNLFMLGYAYQKGRVPISAAAINEAIALNGAAVKMNQAAFLWGRRAAHDRAAVERIATPPAPKESSEALSQSLDEMIERRAAFLADYQDAAWAGRYRDLVALARSAEGTRTPGMAGFAEAVARYAFKVMAYKDEYEVARLYTNGEFEKKLHAQFEGDFTLRFHLAPPLLSRRHPRTGELQKRSFGPWMLPAFRVLAKLRGLRGTRFDVFGYTAERRAERRLVGEYEALVREIAGGLAPARHATAVELARLPEIIRGYGHVKAKGLAEAEKRKAQLLALFRGTTERALAAE